MATKQDILALSLQKQAARQDVIENKIAALQDMLFKVAEGVDATIEYVKQVTEDDGSTPVSPRDVTQAEANGTEELIAQLQEDVELLTKDSPNDPAEGDNSEVDATDPKLVGTAGSLDDILERISRG